MATSPAANATNFFWVVGGEVRTSSGEFCFNGVTRANVMALCAANGIPCRRGDFPPADLLAANEAFCTGTFGGITPVARIDGRALPGPLPSPVTARLIELYERLKDA